MIEYNSILFTNINLIYFVMFALILSLAFDLIFGELPARIHPVVVMGSVINFFKRMFIGIKNRFSGLFLYLACCIVLSIVLYLIYLIISVNVILFIVIFIILLSSTFSVKMLLSTARDVEDALNESIEKARELVSYLVSRNTDELTESFIVSAAIESMTENITDSYVAPVFYYFIFSSVLLYFNVNNILFYLLLIPMIYRLSNTLDAMVGYENDELRDIGYVPAKMDDILNYIPARISGLYVVLSAYLLKLDGKNAFRVMMRDARNSPSPNSGYTMASTAGALNIQLVKKDTYILGDDKKDIVADDISKAVSLSRLAIMLFTLTVILLLILIVIL
ncbi:MAG: cobalamin biosynthesis protein [Methanobrevibacter sp.]|nr:cobalamin biosynthesis protein [Methanobrevibacter sp.]